MAGEFDRWEAGAVRVLTLAQEEAHRFRHRTIGPDHLLLGFLRHLGREDPRLVEALALDLDRLVGVVRDAHEAQAPQAPPSGLGALLGRLARPGHPAQAHPRISGGEIFLSAETRRMIALANEEAQRLNAPRVRVGHVGLALLRWERIADHLSAAGVDLDAFQSTVSRLADHPTP
jgi:ATP-dependent Clp protease ATP-binding subunit ClpC